jgi:glycolate oxidase
MTDVTIAPTRALELVVHRLVQQLGPDAVITDELRRRTYECDGLTQHRSIPGVVVLPTNAEQVAATVAICVAYQVPFVARGAGTGLSAGAMPSSDGVLIVLTKLRAVLEVDLESRRVVVEPGVTNLEISEAVSASGYFYAPDPSSQQVCTIGGNVAENSGGAHCLKYGFTTNHVTGLKGVSGDGTPFEIGGKAPDPPGYDLLGAFVGSEGTLGIATEVTVRLVRKPETIVTLLAAFESIDLAGTAVSAVIASGVLPAAIEMMDALAIEAVEVAVHANYPKAGAVLLIEIDGPADEVAIDRALVEASLLAHRATELRSAESAAERALLWKGRKSAFAAVGRISPHFIVQDGVVPRTALGEVLASIGKLTGDTGVRVANVFHAGDGNLHPLVLFDAAIDGQQAAAEEISAQIIALCVDHGGSITGEHGVGLDKIGSISKMFTHDDLDTMQMIRCAFDPDRLSNPGKIFPTPRLCGEAPRVRRGDATGSGEALTGLF